MSAYNDPGGRDPRSGQPSGQPKGPEGGREGFKLTIDERDLMTGSYDPAPLRSASDPYPATPYSRTEAYTSEADRRREKKAARQRNRLKARKNKRVFQLVWLCMVLLLSFTLASYLITGADDFLGKGRTTGSTKVTVPESPTEEEIAQLLYDCGAIRKTEFFTLYCKITSDAKEFQPGTYQLSTDMDYQDIITTLEGGNDDREIVTVTFPEGINTLEAAALLEENEVCTAQEFLDAVNSGEFGKYDMIGELTDLSDRYFDLEGYLFPDTYDFYKDEELESVVGKLLNNFQVKMSDSMTAMIQSSGMTLDQVITLASIIQAEAATQADMFDVSSVLHNRLNYGADYGIYGLACDSTTFYPYRDEASIPAAGALQYGAYDTYQIEGLPPGPICNPGIAAIRAALRPSDSDNLYFCHDADGNAYYATNEEDHYANLILAGLVEE